MEAPPYAHTVGENIVGAKNLLPNNLLPMGANNHLPLQSPQSNDTPIIEAWHVRNYWINCSWIQNWCYQMVSANTDVHMRLMLAPAAGLRVLAEQKLYSAVLTQLRSTSATLQACEMHPSGLKGGSASKTSLIEPIQS